MPSPVLRLRTSFIWGRANATIKQPIASSCNQKGNCTHAALPPLAWKAWVVVTVKADFKSKDLVIYGKVISKMLVPPSETIKKDKVHGVRED